MSGIRVVAATAIAACVAATIGSTGHAKAAPAEATTTVVVTARGGVDDLDGPIGSVGGTIERRLPFIDAVSATVPTASVGALRANAAVQDVSSAAPVSFEGQYGEGSGVASAVYSDVVGASKLWKDGITGAGMGVAVIDTGINATGDLSGKVAASLDLSGDNDGKDYYGHGTFIGGLIAGSGAASGGAVKGVAPGAHLVSVKIAGRDGSADVTHVLAALQWVVSFKDAHNIRVVNLSLGTDSTQDYRIDPLNRAVEEAWKAGIVVVVSASNRGPDARTISKPADDPWVVTVGASDDRTTVGAGDDSVAPFSAVGPTASNGLAKPDLVAPGKSVVSTRAVGSYIDKNFPSARVQTAYFKGSGTSFSTAITSGVAAMVLQKTPSLTPNQVKHRLTATADAGPVTDRHQVGAGWIDAYDAVNSTSTASANQGIEWSDGSGSLDLSRGSLSVQIQTGTITGLLGQLLPILVLVDGLLTAQDQTFDDAEYFGTSWSASRWYDSQWSASRWYASRWYGTEYYASRWYASRWY